MIGKGPTDINYLPGENVIDYVKAEFCGKDKTIDFSLKRTGDLVLTNQRVIFKGGVVLGMGFGKEVSIPLRMIVGVSSERRLLKGGAWNVLIIKWSGGIGTNSIVLMPTGAQTYGGGILTGLKRVATLDFGGPSNDWANKILGAKQQYHPPSVSPQETGVTKNFCPNCGAKVEGGKFCNSCGAPL